MTSADPLRRLLDGTYPDPDGGAPLGVPSRNVVIADTLDGMEADAVRSLGLDGTFAVVSDPTTREVLGARVERAVRSIGRVESVVLPDRPYADTGTAARLGEATRGADVLVAVGSGTINDLCKYVAAGDGKPWAVFATAPSMNGYTAKNAAITVEGLKKSLPATVAAGVFIDLGVLAAAPRRMIRAGLGDSICRCTAQADWLMSHLVRGSAYREAPYALLADDEDGLLAEPEALVSGDLAAMGRLARTLVLSGFGLTIHGTSHPGSQGEHLISHYIDMMHPPDRPHVFHGEQVGVATLAMARLQEGMLAGAAPRLGPTQAGRAGVVSHFGAAIGEACWAEFERKTLDRDAAERLNARLAEIWPEVQRRLAGVTRPAAALADVLRRAGAPLAHGDIHLSRDFYRGAVRHAREIRDRFTFLDLADDSGRLDPDALM